MKETEHGFGIRFCPRGQWRIEMGADLSESVSDFRSYVFILG